MHEAAPRLPTFRRSLTQAALAMLAATALGIAACGGGGGGGDGDDQLGTDNGPLDSSEAPSTVGRTIVLGASLNAPWGLAFLPNGSMLVSEKAGSIALVDSAGNFVRRLNGVPVVDATGQGGLLDIVVNAGFVYFSYSEPGGGTRGTAVARATLDNAASPTTLQNVQVIWRQTPKNTSGVHYGARIAFGSDGTMFIAAGERGVESNDGNEQPNGVQNAANSLGKVLRLNPNGDVPSDNPSFGASAVPGLYSTGHRNPQGAAVRPGSNELWLTEHGPQGGDELNRVVAGGNYGWPVKSYGCPYNGQPSTSCRIGGGTHAPSYREPATIWVPTSVAPSGLLFYTGNAFPQWQGDLFSGALAGTSLWRVVIDGNGSAVSRQEIQAVKDLHVRIRDVRQGPDGKIYLLTNNPSSGPVANGDRIVRLEP